jgi:hypothetical protein
VKALKDRMLADLKASPVKAGMLGVGLLVAVVVWGPRLRASIASTNPSAAAVPSEGGEAALRDPEAIRAAFIHVSKEARLLRRYADPQDPGAVANDPFVHADGRGAAKAVPEVEIAPAEPASDADANLKEAEATAAAQLSLTGSAMFGATRMAIVNGDLVRVGDRVGAFTVIEIGDRTARVRGAHGTYALVIPTEEKKS